MSKVKVRHPMLQSSILKNQLSHLLDTPAYKSAVMAVEQLGDIFDGIEAFRSSPDPTMSRDGQEATFRGAYTNAIETAERVVKSTRLKLIEHEATIYKDAKARAGLARSRTDPELVEIRSALRSMNQAQRDKALAKALDAGDQSVFAALQDVSPMLYGDVTQPIDAMTGMFIEKFNPDIRQQLADVNTAITSFDLSVEAFGKEAHGLRDLEREREASRTLEANKQATAKLGLAVQERPAT